PGTGGQPDTVLDHGLRQYEVASGPDSTITLDSDGSLGELTRASGNLTLDVLGFVQVQGFLSLQKSTQTIKLADQSTVQANLLAIGGSDLSGFVGMAGEPGERIGLAVDEVEFALALLSDRTDTTRSWTSLQATAGQVAFEGIAGLTMSATSLSVAINQAGKDGDKVVDYASGATALTVTTDAQGDTLKLEMKGSEGEVTKAAGHLDVDLFGFFSVEGGFGIEQRHQDVVLSDGSTIEDAQVITIGGSGINAFAGINAGTSDAVGLSLGQVDFGLALIRDPEDATRRFTSLQASAGSAAFSGITGLTVQAQQVLVNLNQGITLAAQPEQTIKVNTELKLAFAHDFVGTLKFSRAAGTGYGASSADVQIGRADTEAQVLDKLKAGLQSLAGIGANNVRISGNRVDGYVVEFIGTLSGVNVADITATAQSAATTYQAQTAQTAQAGVDERKQVVLQALREEPAPVSITVSTLQDGVAGVDEANVITFTNPGTAGAYTVYLVSDGLVAQQTAGAPGTSEVQRLSLVADTRASAPTGSATVTQVQPGGAGASAALAIVFKAEKVIQEYDLFLMSNPAKTVRAVYRGDANVAQTISEMRTAYATLLKDLTGGQVRTSAVQVELDTAYNGPGDRYVVRFTGDLAGRAIPATGFKFHLGSKASSSTGYTYTTVSDGAAQSEVQKVQINASGAGSFTLKLTHGAQTYTTTGIQVGANAATVAYALNAALGSAGRVEATSAGANTYLVTFGGALAGVNLADLQVTFDTASSAPGGSFTLSYGGQTTRNISYSSDAATLAARVQSELARLSNIGAGNVRVSLNAQQSNSGLTGLDIAFTGTLANTDAQAITVNTASLVNATASTRTITAGVGAQQQVQRIVLGSDALAQGFRLTLTHQGQTYTTALIAGNASAAQVQSAVNAAFGQIAGAQFTAQRVGSDEIRLSVGGSLAGQNLNLLALQAQGSSAQGSTVQGQFVVGNTTQNIANLRTAYAELFKHLTGGTRDDSAVQVTYRAVSTGEQYTVRFVGALGQQDLPGKGISISSTTLDWTLNPNGANATTEQQLVVVDRAAGTQGTFRLALTHAGKTWTTADIALGATTAQVQTALRAATTSGATGTLGAQGTITVSGQTDRYTVEFAGALRGTNLALLNTPALQVDAQLPQGSFQISYVNEQGDRVYSGPIAYSANAQTLRANLQAALDTLYGGAGRVAVSVDGAQTEGRRATFVLNFQGTLARTDIADITTHFGSSNEAARNLSLAVVKPSNLAQGEPRTGEVQRIT
ncbi:MAG: hypothetical protein ACK52R_02535, partial [Betaproteobacteria bacterium]